MAYRKYISIISLREVVIGKANYLPMLTLLLIGSKPLKIIAVVEEKRRDLNPSLCCYLWKA